MRPAVIVEIEIAADRRAGLGHAVVGSEIHLLVFDAAPQPLNEDVVAPRALSVHADRDAILDQHAGERHARELRALVCIEDLWLAVLRQSFLQRLNAECRFHRDGHAPRQNPATEPVEHDSQIDEAARHGDVRDIHRPDLVRPRDRRTTQ